MTRTQKTDKQRHYVITARNRLTGEREAISAPRTLGVAMAMYDRLRAQFDRPVSRQPWRDLKVEEWAPQQSLVFSND